MSKCAFEVLQTEVDICSAVDQKVFDALCCQDSIESLRIKWLRCKQINEIAKLKSLKKVFLAHALSLVDISPLAKLENLVLNKHI